MKRNYVRIIFFSILFVGVIALAVMVFSPFLRVLVLAGVAAIALQPVYRRIVPAFGGKATLAAVATIVLALLVIGAPVAFIGTQVFEESRDMYVALSSNGSGYLEQVTEFIERPIRQYAPYFDLNVRDYTAGLFGWITGNVGSFISGTFQIILGLLLAIITLFFFLRDGKALIKSIKDASPLADDEDQEIFDKVGATINAIVRGMLILGVIQGVLVGLGLLVFGVPNATLWGTFAALAAMVPGLGTGLINGPAIIYLIIAGKYGAAIGLAVWSAVIVGTIDNVLAPYFYNKGIRIHPLVVLLSVLGGLAAFGLLGFIYGPVIVSVFVALMHVYKKQVAD
jgi:predicted PurR-regulated permease PerM